MAKGTKGSLFRPLFPPGGMKYADAKVAGLLRESPVWWMSYYGPDGKRVRESTEKVKKSEAQDVLAIRVGAVAKGEAIPPRLDKMTYDIARDDLIIHYEISGERDLVEVRKRLAHLDTYFRGRRLASIGPADATAYAKLRLSEKVTRCGKTPRTTSPATVNRETALLTKILSHAYDNGKLMRLPRLRKLTESDPRSGFFERTMFEAVKKHLPEDLQVVVSIMYTFGWRLQEVLGLERRHLDLTAGTLTLDVGSTKSGAGRVVFLTPELRALLVTHLARTRTLEKKLKAVIGVLFPNFKGTDPKQVLSGQTHVKVLGARRQGFRKAWMKACEAGGATGMLVHDLRRTAARDLIRAGVPERVAMDVTGHRTRSVFDRYNIVAPADLKRAAELLAQASK